MSKRKRTDEIPPDGWVTKLRDIFGISEDATWQEILWELEQVKRHADKATRAWLGF